MYQLIQGSIFDSKCDLIIIPCNNMGGITSFMQRELAANNLPLLRKEIPPGDVCFLDDVGDFTNSSAIGYAASVALPDQISRTEYLTSIGEQIVDYCASRSFHVVNLPLLGTGAGGLPPQTSFDTLAACVKDNRSIQFRIFALSKKSIAILKEPQVRERYFERNPRVFISYTGIDNHNRQWVKNLACKLRGNGVNARLDLFHLKGGQDLAQWMTNEVLMADKVLLICDKHYAVKADLRRGGVGWETMIIQGDMMSHLETNKYICIVREENFDKGIPIYAKSRFSFHWPEEAVSDDQYQELLFDIFDCDMEPPLGPIPQWVLDNLHRI